MPVLNGKHSRRVFERFPRIHKGELVEVFKLKHGVSIFQTPQKALKLFKNRIDNSSLRLCASLIVRGLLWLKRRY